ncbi:MAG: hypothetical protein ACRDN0_01985 [Trebonia sp.]
MSELGTRERPATTAGRNPRRRTLGLLLTGTVIAAAGTAATVVLLTAGNQTPTAASIVISALTKTSAENYGYSVESTVRWNGRDINYDTVSGVVAPRHELGTESLTARSGKIAAQIRFIGDYVYTRVSSGVKLPAKGKSWDKAPALAPAAVVNPDSLYGFATDQPVSPAAISQVLRSASTVRAVGRASGPGWTGTAYGFSSALPGGRQSVTGTIDIDREGQVRRLVTVTTDRKILTLRNLTFSEFGTPVRTAPPPAAQTMDTSNPYWDFYF